jgi:hypothetical protein
MAIAERLVDRSPDTVRPTGGGMAGQIPMQPAGGVTITEDGDEVMVSSSGAKVTVRADGGVDIDTNPQPEGVAAARDTGFDENLAEVLDERHLGAIAADLIEGINADETTRANWIATYNDGIDLLALKLEKPNKDAGTISTVRHPVLLEAVIRGQSLARSELLPASGPCKVRNDAADDEAAIEMATDLEQDFNHYLTVTATEYYPDTDRGFFYLYYGGVIYKKVYSCPLRKRPVSECVYAPDLIVSNEATDLQNALRVTHVIPMSAKRVRQLQLAGMYLDVQLTTPSQMPRPTEEKEAEVSGVGARAPRPQDQERTIYECYTDLDLGTYGHKEKDVPERLPVPYKVSLDKDGIKVLEIRRDWKEGDKEFQRRKHFVKYGLIPGLGFLDYGYVHILGNTAKALTGMWRILIDSGMFNSFPGGVKVKGRNDPKEIQPAPGEFPTIDIGAVDDIRKAIMPFPYNPPSPVLLQLAQQVGEDAQRLGNAVQIESGEGRTNVPVGTMMTMIEQQTQVMQAVHKRLHTAQQEELLLLKDLFAEDPSALHRFNKDPARQWKDAAEFQNANLVPASDPNVPAQVHRIMQATALSLVAGQNPDLYKRRNVQKRILKTLHIDDDGELLKTDAELQQDAQNQPQPQDPKAAGQALNAQAKQDGNNLKRQEMTQDAQNAEAERRARLQEIAAENAQREQDRQSREKVALIHEDTEKVRLQQEQAHSATLAASDAEHARNTLVHQADHKNTALAIDAAHKHATHQETVRHNQATEDNDRLGLAAPEPTE